MPDETTTTAPTAEPTTAAPTAAAAPEAPPNLAESGKAARMEKAQAIVARHQAAEAGEAGDEAKVPGEPAEPAAAEAPDEGAPAVEGPVRDPATGKFVSHDEAVRRGLAPVPAAAVDGATVEQEATPAGAAAGKVKVKGPAASGEGHIEIELDGLPDETVKTIQTWAKGGMRKSEYLDQLSAVERERGEVREFTEMLTTAPEHVLPAHLPAEAKSKVVLALLQDKSVFEEVSGTLEEWDLDPAARERARADRLEADNKHRRDMVAKRDTRARYAKLETAIVSMVPEGASQDEGDRFFRDACRDVEEAIRGNGRIIDVTDLDTILAHRRQLYGYAETAGEGGTPRAPSNGSAAGAGNGAKSGPRKATGSADPEKLRKLTTAPAGAGAPAASGLSVPKDIKLGEKGESSTGGFLRKTLGLTRW